MRFFFRTIDVPELCLLYTSDPATLYRAFAAASAGRPNLHLFHVGSGELEGELDRLVRELGISSRVTRMGYLRDTSGFYKAVDGMILTSKMCIRDRRASFCRRGTGHRPAGGFYR